MESQSHNVFDAATKRQKKANLGNQDTPEEGPDDVAKVQQHHVLEEQRWQSKLGHKVAQTLGLVLCDDISPAERSPKKTAIKSSRQRDQNWDHSLDRTKPASDVATHDDSEALQEGWKELVD